MTRSGESFRLLAYEQSGNADSARPRNQGKEALENVAIQSGIAVPTRLRSGWGLKFFDLDNDGALDLMLANGHPDTMVTAHPPSVEYNMPMLLLRGAGTKFENVPADRYITIVEGRGSGKE